ncbi:hypothetical protein [Streptomyces pinistramenti]|uniref:hypothetical protein n=1 Tax=Streptomyces pinistramenti TaxID=2884812 RepID=UPI001D08643A|nr:hypothetical protein [Streptomyces pinistramenti]MCB5911739.1 hypothetical protein [Streptomyces pinistramenti]
MGLNEVNGRRAAAPSPAPRPAAAPPERTPQPAAVRIDIGELALDGFDAGMDPDRVSASFTRELARLVRERGVPLAADGTGVTLDGLAGLPPLPAATSPARLGEALARAVHAGLAGRGEAR